MASGTKVAKAEEVATPVYRRVLLKLSGEALMGEISNKLLRNQVKDALDQIFVGDSGFRRFRPGLPLTDR